MHSTAQARGSAFSLAAAGFGGGEAEGRAQAFAAGEKRVAHRLVNRRRLGRGLRQETIECAIDLFLAREEIAF